MLVPVHLWVRAQIPVTRFSSVTAFNKNLNSRTTTGTHTPLHTHAHKDLCRNPEQSFQKRLTTASTCYIRCWLAQNNWQMISTKIEASLFSTRPFLLRAKQPVAIHMPNMFDRTITPLKIIDGISCIVNLANSGSGIFGFGLDRRYHVLSGCP